MGVIEDIVDAIVKDMESPITFEDIAFMITINDENIFDAVERGVKEERIRGY